MSDLDLPAKTFARTPAESLDGVTTEELLATALQRLTEAPGDGRYALAASHVEEALRQVRKPPRAPVCGDT